MRRDSPRRASRAALKALQSLGEKSFSHKSASSRFSRAFSPIDCWRARWLTIAPVTPIMAWNDNIMPRPAGGLMASMEIRELRKSFGPVEVVRGVSIDIADGEFVVLVGPSGCGKSTLLRMIAGLESASSGEIRIGDRIVNDVPPKARDIAMVFQNYALYPHMTVAENMSFALRLKHASKAEITER